MYTPTSNKGLRDQTTPQLHCPEICMGPICVTAPEQIASARYCMGHPAAAPSLWTPGQPPTLPTHSALSFQNEIGQL